MAASSVSGPSTVRASPVQHKEHGQGKQVQVPQPRFSRQMGFAKTEGTGVSQRVAAPSPVAPSVSPVSQYTAPLPLTPHPYDPNPEVHMERVRQQKEVERVRQQIQNEIQQGLMLKGEVGVGSTFNDMMNLPDTR